MGYGALHTRRHLQQWAAAATPETETPAAAAAAAAAAITVTVLRHGVMTLPRRFLQVIRLLEREQMRCHGRRLKIVLGVYCNKTQTLMPAPCEH